MTAIVLHAPSIAPRKVAFRIRSEPIYRRRRFAALLVATTIAAAGFAAVDALGGGPLTAAEAPSHRAGSTGAVALDAERVARSVYVVRAGDTLWSIARSIRPDGDVRPLVDSLARTRGGRPLQPGERIVLP